MPKKTSLLAPWVLILLFVPSFVHAYGLQQLHGHIPKEATFAPMIGSMDPEETLDLSIGLPLRNQNDLDQLSKELYDPHSPLFRHFLSVTEFTQRFGPTDSDYESVINFAKANGLTVTHTHSNHLLVDVRGSVDNIQKAFHVKLNRYRREEGTEFHAPDQEPSIDLNTPVDYISGLENSSLPKPAFKKHRRINSSVSSNAGSGTGGAYFGTDFRNAYLPSPCVASAIKGAGQTIALVEFDTYYPSDITKYTTNTGLGPANLTNVPIVTPTATPGSGNSEVALDIDMILCLAQASQIYVYETSGNADTLLNRIASDNVAKQISCSWTGFGDSTTVSILAEYVLQGQAFFQAAGDDGAYVSGDPITSVPIPISKTSNMTVVGGTNLITTGTGSTLAYSSETTWNDVVTVSGNVFGGSGGGGICSSAVPIPTYQVPFGGTNSTSTLDRNIPDVSMIAENVEIYDNNGSTDFLDGTSAATPLWAALTALINEVAQNNGKGTVGFLNPYLYTLANNSGTYTSTDFHDITSGNNNYSGTNTSEYQAVSGYDLATGLGSPKCAIVADLAGLAPTPTNTPTITFTPTKTFTPTITFTPTNTGTPTNTSTPPSTTNSYVFPEPAHGQANFVYNSTVAQNIRIDIYNFTGQIVSSVEDTAQISNSNRTTLPLQGFAPGVYFYFIRGSSSGIIARGKFVAVP